MSNKQILLSEIESAPETVLAEVLDFIRFLKVQKTLEHLEPAILSEPSLAKDWNRPEEEDAWRDL